MREVGTYEEAYNPCLNYGEVGGENGEPGHGARWKEKEYVMKSGKGKRT